jgi:hypothetical protein
MHTMRRVAICHPPLDSIAVVVVLLKRLPFPGAFQIYSDTPPVPNASL